MSASSQAKGRAPRRTKEVSFDLRDCVRESVEIFSPPAREKGLNLEVKIEEQVPRKIVGDPDRIGQVLINIVGNAVKFTHQGHVRVLVKPKGRFLEFSVEDTGIGIAEEKLDLLFQSFSQVDSSFTRKFGGTGLGLAISKGLVELMGGEISVQSRKGEGSAFSFTLPLKAVQAEHPYPAEVLVEEERPVSARILLAEDDPMIREVITRMLARKGGVSKGGNGPRGDQAGPDEGSFCGHRGLHSLNGGSGPFASTIRFQG